MTHSIARHPQGWVVLRPDGSVAQEFGPGPKSAQEAAQAALVLDATTRPRKRTESPDGTLLRNFRAVHGLTQQSLADKLGVDLTTVQRWEWGQVKPAPYLSLALRQLVTEQLV